MKSIAISSVMFAACYVSATGTDYLLHIGFGLGLNPEFNFGLAFGLAIGFWNWAGI
jgi:hypothetical protein